MIEKQKTITNTVTITGVGLHTGRDVTLTFRPAPENFGYKFQRTDLDDQPIIKADIDYVIDALRGTTIEKDGVRIGTIEHTLAAIAGLGIDNILIEIDASEPPIMDGSAKCFVDALLKAGLQEQPKEKKYYELNENIHFEDIKNKVELLAVPSNDFKVTVMIDFDSSVIGMQHTTLYNLSQFKDEYASARTFVFLHDLEYLLKNNLIKGGDLSNAIVIADRTIDDEEIEHLAKLFKKSKPEIRKKGILNVDLRHPNEPARHKLLDLIGDLALIGIPLKAHIIANRPGHFFNVKFAKAIKDYIRQEKKIKKVNIPKIDLNIPPLYDINHILKILPHRPPFLLIDRIIEMGKDYVIGMKNVTMNEAFFVGHFPDEPVMPGVLQIEAMAQVGGILALSSVDNPKDYISYFLRIDKARFKHKVVPGDTLIFKMILKAPIRRGICEMYGTAYVGNKIVTEAELMAQIVKKENK